MKISRIDPLLNDQEINFLADLFLSCFKLDKHTKRYRYFKNAMLLFSHGMLLPHEVYGLLSKSANIESSELKTQLRNVISDLPRPIHEIFNDAYAPDRSLDDNGARQVQMDDNPDLDYILTFLGTAFLYIVLTNYPKYEYVVLDPK